ncbi:YeeE/YedE family protein [Shewanella intestini]|uniref:YeeE/YedE family protein n=1 Tax=Shewanella intestini TaxID=2017544 RepID=A0ABS5I4E2_9GAMM|nr:MULTISPECIES: YeeE/YedE thiosulfate transporter family protein [Shewanella]MBR9728895.1 YeeE/YedE family protein [Shewanella intestini]MRG37039.1 YeeE/YedE family protein [Shewanella sp. XMDDZSB0408]
MLTQFTPLSALLGGAFLGFAALLLLIGNGKIAGISGITSKAINPKHAKSWHWSFVLGLIVGPLLLPLSRFELPQNFDSSWLAIIVGGFLVGLGSVIGSGCTSGHGVCGIGRFSKRSIIATITFMFTAVVVVFLRQHFAISL